MKLALLAARRLVRALEGYPSACNALGHTSREAASQQTNSWATFSRAFRSACNEARPSLPASQATCTAHQPRLRWAGVRRALIQGCGQGRGSTEAGRARQYSSRGWIGGRSYIPEIPGQTALYGLMGANAAVFLLWRADPRFTALNFTTSLEHMRAGRLHTLVTSAFSQRDTTHLFSNMIGLFFFGRSAAGSLGGKGLVALYLACGTFGSLVYITGQAIQSAGEPKYQNFMHRSSAIPALGSSGAVNGIVMFDILLFPTATILFYGVLPMPAWVLGAVFLAFDINGALGRGHTNVGYTVHLAGAAMGALACWGVRRGKLPSRYRRW